MLMAAPKSELTFSIDKADKLSLAAGSNVLGMSPTIATSLFRIMLTINATIIPTSEEGTLAFHFFGHANIMTTTSIPNPTA